MSPFLAVADLADGKFAVVTIDPSKRIGSGCSAVVQSLHDTKEAARAALQPHVREAGK